MTRIFFYGLFMDRSLLTEKGLHPVVVGRAALPDFRLHIGDRATLLRSAGGRAYGIVMELSEDEARDLYADPSVCEYIPEPVQVEMMGLGETVEALCYNLPPELAVAGTNPAYAVELSQLVERLGFDASYVEEAATFTDES